MEENNKNRILFISHSYPPVMGGVEAQNYNLAQGLSKISRVSIIANGKGKMWLPIFIPITLARSVLLMLRNDVCLVGNGVLAPLAAALKLVYPAKKFFCVVHGLDITYASKKGFLPAVYRNVNVRALKKLDKLFMVGNSTITEAVKAGIPEDMCVFIPNGVPIGNIKRKHGRDQLSKLLGIEIVDKKIILRLGRFVPHKGTDWFIKNIMPRLPEDTFLVATGHRVGKNTAGDPDNFASCEQAIKEAHLENRVRLMPDAPQVDVEILLNTVDLVVSPNINFPGSLEGFGINVIEAGACERIVIASNLQGLADAIKDGQNGFLVEPENIEAWTAKIKEVLSFSPEISKNIGKMSAQFIADNFTWEKISLRYLNEIEKVVNGVK